MRKVISLGLVVAVVAFVATVFAGRLSAQTVNPTPTTTMNDNVSPSPTPTTNLPSGAPQTGFGN